MFFFSHWLILIKGSQSIFCLSASSFPIGQSIKIGIIISGHWLIVIQWPTINLVHFSSSVRLLSLFLLFKPTPSPSSMSSLFLYYGCLSSNCICLCLLQKRTDRGDREKYIRWRQLCWSGEIRFGGEVSERRGLVWKRQRLWWDKEVEEEEAKVVVDLHEHRTPEVYIGFGKMTTTAQAGPSFGEEEAGRERESSEMSGRRWRWRRAGPISGEEATMTQEGEVVEWSCGGGVVGVVRRKKKIYLYIYRCIIY